MKHKEAYPVRYLRVMSRRYIFHPTTRTMEAQRRIVTRAVFGVATSAAVAAVGFVVYEYAQPADKFLAIHGELGRCAIMGVAQSHNVAAGERVSVVARGFEQTIVFDISGQPVSFEAGSMCGSKSMSGVVFQASIDDVGGPPSSSIGTISFP